MRIYLAAAYPRAAEIDPHAAQLRAAGHTVTSRWHAGSQLYAAGDTGSNVPSPEVGQQWANADLADLCRAELLLSFTDGKPARGGRHVEFGFAHALCKLLWIVGPREHCFHCLSEVRQFDTFEAALAALSPKRPVPGA